MKEGKVRNFGLDLIRVFAAIFVIIVHTFANTNFYNTKINGMSSFILLNIRWLTYICVPLFLILTGYLKSEKRVDRNHYKTIKNILIVYISISIITILYRIFFLKDFSSAFELVAGIFNSSAIGYAWYIEMYIGLFLLIPFLNILYKNIINQRQKQILLITLFFICSIPQTIGSLKIGDYILDIMPSWWGEIYPILYYFIGCYIKEYQPKLKPVVNIILLCFLLFFQSFMTYYICKGDTFLNSYSTDYNCFSTIVLAILFFILFYNTSIHGNKIRKIVAKISQLSLSMYLFSWMFDKIFYTTFSFLLKGSNKTWIALVTVTPIVIIASFTASWILDIVIKGCTKLCIKINKRHKEKYGIKF